MIWHCLTCIEGEERKIAWRSGRIRCDAKVPLETVADERGKPTKVPILPGYVWIGTNGAPDWPAVKRLPGVFGVLGADDEPHAWTESEMAWVESLASVVQQSSSGQPLRRPRVGDVVSIRRGHAAIDAKVIGERAGRLLGELSIFGSLRVIEFAPEAIEEAA